MSNMHLLRKAAYPAVVVGFLLFLTTSVAVAQVDVLTQHNDSQRSGLNTKETALNHQTVKSRFGKLWTLSSDAKVMAQPLYVSNLKSAKCPDGCNTVIFASMKDTLYAYKADEKPSTSTDTLVWVRHLGNPKRSNKEIDKWSTDEPWWGILSTPVIDRATGSLYAVVWNKDSQYRIYNVDLSSGEIKQGPVIIEGSFAGKNFVESHKRWKQLRKQRAALLLANGDLYIAFGGDNPDGPAGWLFVYDAATLALKAVWSPTPHGRNGGIWQGGQGPAVDSAGDVYLQTGDGEFDASRQIYADSMVKLHLGSGDLSVADYFSPCNQLYLDECDLDLGSSGPLLFNDLVVGGGKSGMLYLMRADNLAKYSPGPKLPKRFSCKSIPRCQDGPQLIQKWRASKGHIHGSPVFWSGPAGKSWLYVMGEGDHLKAYPFANGKFDLNGAHKSKWSPPKAGPVSCGGPIDDWMPGGVMSVSSNGNAPGTGIVWAMVPANGDANSYRGVKGMLLAFNAEDVSQELWRSQGRDAALSDTRNSLGLLARFAPPTIANGKVFVGTAGKTEPLKRWCTARPSHFPKHYGVVVYGLKE
jgi:hypothetical protein